MEEFEVKFLDIDTKQITEKILSVGGVKRFERVFVDKVFDYPDWRLDKNAAWVRLRNKGEKITLAFKQRIGVTEGADDKGMYEAEVEVADFDKTAEILEKIGLALKFFEEKKCVSFEVDGVEVNIDHRPLMPPYLEIEGKSWREVEDMAKKLGLPWEKRVILSALQVYKKYGVDEKAYQILTFSEQKKRAV